MIGRMRKRIGNEGRIEQGIQLCLALALAVGGLLKAGSGSGSVFFWLAAVLLAFAWLEFCPLYAVLGINKRPIK